MPPVGGGAAFRPKNKLDQLDDDLPILDDATRKMIMQDIQRGKMPSFPKASGTGVQGASYLLQEKQQNQTNTSATSSSSASTSINKERDAEEIEALLRQIRSQKMGAQTNNNNNNNLNLHRINPEPTKKSTGTSSSQQPQRKLIVHNRPLGNRQDDDVDEENIPELQQQPLPPSNKRPNSGRVLRNHLSFLNKDQTDSNNNNDNPPAFTSLSSDSNSTNFSVNNNDLLEVMTSRLRFLEKQNGFLQSELKEKSIKLSQSQNKLSDAEEAVTKLQSERVVLAKKIVSMSKFLADYGLSWVGDDDDDTDDPENNNKDNTTPEKTGKTFDLYGGNVNTNKIMSNNNNNKNTNDKEDHTRNTNKISADQASGITQGLTIEEEIEKARQQMKKLLHEKEIQDYGGKAVPLGKHDKSKLTTTANSSAANNSSLHFDFDKFVHNCEVLSTQVSQHYFVGGSNDPSAGARRGGNGNNNNTIVSIRPREIVTVVVFADGITVAGGPFRPFGWALCDAFVQDVMDGYFPYEYRGRFPDGFPIDVVDKRRERYLVLSGGDDDLMENSSSSSTNSPNKQKQQQQRQNNNNNNHIRTLNDSPYSLRKTKHTNNQGRIALGQTSNHDTNNNNNYNSLNKNSNNNKKNDKKAKSSFGGRGNQLGGARHAGTSAGCHATRELILKRIPTRYITACGRIINPAAGIAEFLNLPTTSFNTNNSNNNNNNNPQTPPRFSLMKNYKGPMPVILSSKDEVEEYEKVQKQKQDAINKKLLFDEQQENNNNNNNKNDKKRLIRVVFPSSHGLSVEVVVNEDATVLQLHDAVLDAISNSPSLSFAIRPPIDLNDVSNDNHGTDGLHGRGGGDLADMYEMEFIVRGAGDQSNKNNNENNNNNNMGMMGARSNTSTSLMSRECSLDEAGFNAKKRNETVIVRWRKKQ